MRIKLAAAAALALGTLVAATDGASAAGGCGPGSHPNPWGVCRPNWRPAWRPAYRPYGFYGYGPRHVRHWGHGPGWHRGGWHRW